MPQVSLHVPCVQDDHTPPGAHVVDPVTTPGTVVHTIEADGITIGSAG
jgi:hypothetical protein